MQKKKWLLRLASIPVLLLVFAGVMFVLNATPKVPQANLNDPATAARPYVVKLHAQWCPICMATKGAWKELQAAYSGKVNLVVFDLTSQKTKDASRAEAKRLGLEEFFDGHSKEPGSVYVLDGTSKEIKGSVYGVGKTAEYLEAIEEALKPEKN